MPDNSFSIRKANAEDTPTICRIIRLSYKDVAQRFGLNIENCPKHPSNYTQKWVEKDMARGVTFFILETSEGAKGCAALEVVDETLCYLERLAVLPNNRKNGLGRKLVEHTIEEARALGMKKASIGIIAKQQGLMQWYQKIGFERGETKTFEHLPFSVRFMSYRVK